MSIEYFDPTEKQLEILRLVFKSTDAGVAISFEDLKAKLSYGPKVSKQALSCSLKFLRQHGAIEVVYGDHHGPYRRGLRCFIIPTPDAYKRFRRTSTL